MFSFNDAAVIVKEEFEKVFYRTFARNTVFMSLIEPKKKATKEKDVRWKVQYSSNPAAGSYREDGSIGINRNDLRNQFMTASMDWKLNGVPTRVSGLAQAVTQSERAIIDAIAEETEQGVKQLQNNMNLQMLSDGVGGLNGANSSLSSSGTDLIGIQAAIDDGTLATEYAGINRSTYTWWQSIVSPNPVSPGTNRPFTELLAENIMSELRDIRRGKITHIFCSPGVHRAIGALLSADRTFHYAADREPEKAPSYHGGTSTLYFKGVAITAVPLYENNRIDFIDVDLLEYHVLQDFTIEPRDAGDQDATAMWAKTYSLLLYKNPYLGASLQDISDA